LSAREVEIVAPEESRDFATKLVGQVMVGFDSYGIEVGDGVAHVGRPRGVRDRKYIE
jgi:hypothetical protein